MSDRHEGATYTRGTVRSALRRLVTERGHDAHAPAIEAEIERVVDEQVLISLDGSRLSALTANGDPIRGRDPLGKLANALSARIENDKPLEPVSLDEVKARQARDVPYARP